MVGLHDVWIIRRVAVHVLSYLVLEPDMWTHLERAAMPPCPSLSLERWIRMRRLLVRALSDDTCPSGPPPTLTNQMLWPYCLEHSTYRHGRELISRLHHFAAPKQYLWNSLLPFAKPDDLRLAWIPNTAMCRVRQAMLYPATHMICCTLGPNFPPSYFQ